ncbi:MAG: DUF6485 family protein [Candidatus Muirbacterium halophilum]|nr:DUF6485 family protein [Candidatus Muirbacterium halophilum]MCK9474940.1 DUF6485 family protein [Candidatus Muirbacterium halophilum]
MESCKNKEINIKNCNCTYEPCARKGLCCECISSHRKNNELPACYFTIEEEATFDRSIEFFVKNRSK